MTIIEIKTNQKTLQLQVPDYPSEILFRQYINFIFALKRFNELIETDSRKINSIEAIELLCVCVSEYFEIDPKEIFGLEIDTDNFKKLFDAKYSKKVSATLISLLNRIKFVIDSCGISIKNTNEYSFEYKGETYYVSHNICEEVIKKKQRPALTFGEVMEIMETKRLLGDEFDKNGDPNGSLYYEEGLRLIAILARKKNELIPITNTENWISARAVHFKDIKFQVFRDLDFFLSSILIQSTKTNNIIMSLTQ